MITQNAAKPASGLFAADDLVIETRPLLDDAPVPRFGDTRVWDFNGVLRRPANISAAGWKLVFSEGLADPRWNLLARELCMIYLNPRHPAITAAGLSLKPEGAKPQTVIGKLSHLRCLARWISEQDEPPPPLASWGEHDVRRFLTYLSDNRSDNTRRNYIELLRSLHECRPVLSWGGLAAVPWGDAGRQTSRRIAHMFSRVVVKTPAVPPEQWFPLVRASWTYVHTFAPDILRAHAISQDLHARARNDIHGLDNRLESWLADPANRIPVHSGIHAGRRATSSTPQPHFSALTLLLGMNLERRTPAFGAGNPASRRRRDMVLRAIATGHPTTTGLVDNLAQVTRPDGSVGPWHPGLDHDAERRERIRLRNACFCLVVALSMMRDSEVHEITKNSVVEYFGTPAIASTKHKHDANMPIKHWWITEPVAEAIAVAEQISAHPERVFFPMRSDAEILDGVAMLASFIAHVNATRQWTGLDAIPTGSTTRPHMFRKTMAMLTDQFAGSEIALGIQLKHVATRALANRSTQGYAAADPAWSEHLETAIEAARFRRLEDLYGKHQAGEPIGFGPAAERMTALFDHIQDTVKARNGDSTVETALLRKARISLRFGILNHCAFDEANPAGALCLDNAITPPGHTGPLQDRCRPGRCANSIIAPEHLPIWDAEKRTLLTLLDTPKLASCRKAALQRELGDVDTVLRKANHSTSKEPS